MTWADFIEPFSSEGRYHVDQLSTENRRDHEATARADASAISAIVYIWELPKWNLNYCV